MRLLSRTSSAVNAVIKNMMKAPAVLAMAVLNRSLRHDRATEVAKHVAPIAAAAASSDSAAKRGNHPILSRYNDEATKLVIAPAKRMTPGRYRRGPLVSRMTSHIAIANEIADGMRVVVTE